MKDQLKNNEAIQSELVGQAHIEDAAIKLFFFADTEDRSSRFDKYRALYYCRVCYYYRRC